MLAVELGQDLDCPVSFRNSLRPVEAVLKVSPTWDAHVIVRVALLQPCPWVKNQTDQIKL